MAARAPSPAPGTSPPRSASIRRPARSPRTATPRRCRRGRCIAASTGSGEYLLTAYNYPSNITVHRIKPDGTLGEQVAAARETRRRNFRASGPDHAGQPHGDHGDARQQPGGGQARGPRRAQGLWLQGRRAVEPRLDRSAATGSASARAISTSIRASRGCSSRSSARASCTSIGSTTTARCRREAMFIKNALADRANNAPHPDGGRDPHSSERPLRLP